MDGVQVGAESVQKAQKDKGEKEEEQGDGDCGVSDDLQWEDIAMLVWERNQSHRVKLQNRLSGKVGMKPPDSTSLLEMSISTAKLVM